jgi:hypothetical protein
LTVHKTSMPHDESTPVAPWRARACKAVPCHQTAYAASLRQPFTRCRRQLHPQNRLPLHRRSRSVPEILQMSQSATLKIHN